LMKSGASSGRKLVGTRRSWNPNRLIIVPVWLRRSSWQLTEPASLDTLTFGRKNLAMQKQNSLFQSNSNGGRAIVSNKKGTTNKLVQERRSAIACCAWSCKVKNDQNVSKVTMSSNIFVNWHYDIFIQTGMMNAPSHRHSNLYCWHTRPCM
jgi:hypothetical protein